MDAVAVHARTKPDTAALVEGDQTVTWREFFARYDVTSMPVIIVAAAACPMKVKEDVIRCFGPVLYEFYGSTELGINTILRPDDVLRKPGSCGRAAPGIELAVLDDAGRPVPRGEPGELFVRRYPGVFDGVLQGSRGDSRNRAGRLALGRQGS